jgi:hypothetical protein
MTRLRDQMNIIEESSDMEMLVGSVKDTGGVYFVTAFSGLLAPYWDRDAVSHFSGDRCGDILTDRLERSSVLQHTRHPPISPEQSSKQYATKLELFSMLSKRNLASSQKL